ncbi:MarR family transcriptional regulator [Motilibacter rhizosphaerae]|uniref:MarR family transcriptional regulator n=1 Tax=Motilibacter rhizosphaerae TaxID=598652 RepID=A0A4V2F4L0_9ACTN|nr:MarR family transcriptional regulator [Motilibacter rhizosphaerae]RZS89689.1 MarR family transcriptional regulator [Motilibacter rhizosphaerae]
MESFDQAHQRVERELTVLLQRARQMFAQMAREIHPDLDASAYALLSRIASREATTVSSLAAAAGTGKPTISRQVRALEELGLLRREPDTSDPRVVQLSLTTVGTERLEQARDVRRAALRRLLGEWDVADVESLGLLLAKFNAAPR